MPFETLEHVSNSLPLKKNKFFHKPQILWLHAAIGSRTCFELFDFLKYEMPKVPQTLWLHATFASRACFNLFDGFGLKTL